MSETITKAMTRPGAVPALFAGLGVFVGLTLIGFLSSLLSTLGTVTTSAGGQDVAGQLWLFQLVGSLTGPLPFAIGVFLCFWQLAPIAPTLRLAHVVTRAILAALLGAAVMWVVFVIAQVLGDISSAPFSFHATEVFGLLGPDALGAIFRALAAMLGYLPMTVLSAILLWGWLQRHPWGTAVHGALDEV